MNKEEATLVAVYINAADRAACHHQWVDDAIEHGWGTAAEDARAACVAPDAEVEAAFVALPTELQDALEGK
jgi:hypothetical protein|tara:strand:+ start:305 stop:517 length:213 start_codon:yes stop_codon:yes gene_type:complete